MSLDEGSILEFAMARRTAMPPRPELPTRRRALGADCRLRISLTVPLSLVAMLAAAALGTLLNRRGACGAPVGPERRISLRLAQGARFLDSMTVETKVGSD